MNETTLNLIKECTVRILVGQNKSFGSGFFVAPGLVLTCSHVIEDGQQSDTSVSIIVQWKKEQYKAQVVKAFPKPFPDIALLGIESPISHPCAYLNSNINIGENLYIFGFSDEQPDGDSAMLTYEGPTTIVLENQDETMFKMQSGQIRPGFSGAPILCLRTGCVCGMVKSTRDRDTDMGGRAIPISAVFARFPYLLTQQSLFHQQNPEWVNSLLPEQKLAVKQSYVFPELTSHNQEEVEFIKDRLVRQAENLRSRYISGSSRITIDNLLNRNHNLFVNFRWRLSKGGEPEKEDIANYILDTIPEKDLKHQLPRPKKFLVLSDPGFGKSTLTYKLFCDMVNKFNNDETLCVPIYINLQDYIGDDEFGTQEWTINLLNQLAQSENIGWAGVRDAMRSPILIPYFILDALDEFLSGFSLGEVNMVLKRFIFSIASIVTCRRQYYEKYLFMSDFTQNYEKLHLLDWIKADTDKYTRNYFKFCFAGDEADIFSFRVLTNIEKSSNLRELCQVPLRLNMTLELLSDKTTEQKSIFDLNSLYYVYVFNWLAREASKVNSVLDVEQKYQTLKLIAWNFYDEGKIGQNYQSNKFTRQEIQKVIETNKDKLIFLRTLESEQVVDDLATRSILLEEKGLNYGINLPIIRFAHKSFLEYLVASYLNDSILGKPNDMVESFSRTISQEVAQFLKGYINRINDDSGLLTQAVKTSIEAFKQNQNDPTVRSERRRLASSQLCYHMGHFNSPKIFDFLSKHIERESDFFVKRSIIIGLSFSGHKEYLNQYVDRLREMRSDQVENEINIGNHLSYFGDQPYDDLNPTEDQLIPICRHTVEKLIYQLGTEINRGSWRLDLYTLLDIGKFRPISRKDFIDIMKAKLDDFKLIIDNYKNDSSCKDWPELLDAQALISSIENDNLDFFKIS